MFSRSIAQFQLLGFRVKLDISWIFLAVLVTFSLARGLFPTQYEGLADLTYWTMAIFGAAGLFASIVLHEMSHSVVARHYGIPIRGITLFIFGGVAEMEEEPPTPKSEFLMAMAGPLASVLLSGGFYAISKFTAAIGLPVPITGILEYLCLINLLLAAFNLVPAFPLDGGRALRAVMWHYKQDLLGATLIASRLGMGFGTALVALGILNIGGKQFVAGAWWMLIGLFLIAAARGSYTQLRGRQVLVGEPVSRFMTRDPAIVSADISLRELVTDHIYGSFHEFFPVFDDGGTLIGSVGARQLRQIPAEKWDDLTVRSILIPLSPDTVIAPEEGAWQALRRLHQSPSGRLMILKDDRLVGVLAPHDLLRPIALRWELEGRSS